MILSISTLTLYFTPIDCSIVVWCCFLKGAVTSLRRCNGLRCCTRVVELLNFICNPSPSHKSILFVVFQRLLSILYSFLVNHLVVIIAIGNLLSCIETLLKYILLPLASISS